MSELSFDVELTWSESEGTAAHAHDRCLIGNALDRDVVYEVGAVRVRDEVTVASADEREPAWLSGT